MDSTGWRLGHRPALDGVRGFAVLLVLADHAGFVPPPAGAIGVTVFFVLSGFLITRVIVEARKDGRWSFVDFVGNRVARLMPALAAMVLVVSCAALAAGVAAGAVGLHAARALTYTQNFFMSAETPNAIFRHTWSLAVEEQFYLLWPFALLLVARSPRMLTLLAAAMVGSLAARFALFGVGWVEGAQASLVGNAYALLLGCVLALLAGHLRPHPSMVAVGLAGIGLTCAWGPTLGDARFLIAPVAASVFAGLLVVGCLDDGPLTARPLRFCGRISYALYLWHFPLLVITGTAATGLPALPILGLTFAVATASTLWLEEPVRRWWRARSKLLAEVGGLDVQHRVGRVHRDLVAAERAQPDGDSPRRDVPSLNRVPLRPAEDHAGDIA